jgi:hypothetical protein
MEADPRIGVDIANVSGKPDGGAAGRTNAKSNRAELPLMDGTADGQARKRAAAGAGQRDENRSAAGVADGAVEGDLVASLDAAVDIDIVVTGSRAGVDEHSVYPGGLGCRGGEQGCHADQHGQWVLHSPLLLGF